MDAKEIRERTYLYWFLKQRSISPDRIERPEPPDFVITVNGSETAIEITNLFAGTSTPGKGSELKKQESFRTNWLQRLSRKYYAENDIPISLNIALRENAILDEELASSILDWLGNLSGINECEHIEKTIRSKNEKLCTVYVATLPNAEEFSNYCRWKCINDSGGFVPPLTKSHIATVLDDKQRKISSYKNVCNRVWLLIVADRFTNSGRLDFSHGLPQVAKSGFEEIWVLDYPQSINRVEAN